MGRSLRRGRRGRRRRGGKQRNATGRRASDPLPELRDVQQARVRIGRRKLHELVHDGKGRVRAKRADRRSAPWPLLSENAHPRLPPCMRQRRKRVQQLEHARRRFLQKQLLHPICQRRILQNEGRQQRNADGQLRRTIRRIRKRRRGRRSGRKRREKVEEKNGQAPTLRQTRLKTKTKLSLLFL